jgi:hypothetical protein
MSFPRKTSSLYLIELDVALSPPEANQEVDVSFKEELYPRRPPPVDVSPEEDHLILPELTLQWMSPPRKAT